MRLIINIDPNTYKIIKDENMSGNPWEISCAIANGTPIPDNATNGDVIKAMFKPNRITRMDDVVREEYEFDEVWWNAPYQKGNLDE